MAAYLIEPEQRTVHDHFSAELPTVLTVESGDIVEFRTLNANWGLIDQADPFAPPTKFESRNRGSYPGHPLCGPIAIQGARTGMTLEIRIKTVRTGSWGWSAAGGFPLFMNEQLGVAEGEECVLRWSLDPGTSKARNQLGHIIPMRPFMGIMGMPPDEPDRHSTFVPRFCGGNLDCKELVAGTSLFLPIAVDTGLFSVGDGHAVQGDGEVSGVGLECPMDSVELELLLHPELRLTMPRAKTEEGWITFGLHTDLNEAMVMSVDEMLKLMSEIYPLTRKEALALASHTVDLRITQAVNPVRGVHAVLPDAAIELPTESIQQSVL